MASENHPNGGAAEGLPLLGPGAAGETLLRVHGASGLLTWAVRYNPMHFALLRARVIMLGLTPPKRASTLGSCGSRAAAPRPPPPPLGRPRDGRDSPIDRQR